MMEDNNIQGKPLANRRGNPNVIDKRRSHRDKNIRLLRMDIVARLYKRGYTYREIRDEVMKRLNLPTYGLGTLVKDVQALLKEWQESRIEEMDQALALELQRIDDLVKEASDTRYLVNPTGRFVEGGPSADTGLTGRKIIVDTYGGRGAHGGGAFSGKDPSKVDRSAAYMARFIAKNLVAYGLADEMLVQIAYAIGTAQPVSVMVDTFGTSHLPAMDDERIADFIRKYYDLTPRGIEKRLGLRYTNYQATASYGHFGRDYHIMIKDGRCSYFFPWERVEEDFIDEKLSEFTDNATK